MGNSCACFKKDLQRVLDWEYRDIRYPRVHTTKEEPMCYRVGFEEEVEVEYVDYYTPFYLYGHEQTPDIILDRKSSISNVVCGQRNPKWDLLQPKIEVKENLPTLMNWNYQFSGTSVKTYTDESSNGNTGSLGNDFDTSSYQSMDELSSELDSFSVGSNFKTASESSLTPRPKTSIGLQSKEQLIGDMNRGVYS